MTRYKALATVAVLAMFGCCSKRSTVNATDIRRADSVSEMASLKAHTLQREFTVETIRMREDSTGALRVVSRDLVRTTERGTSTVADTVKATATSSSEAKSETVAETVTTERHRAPWWWVVSLWALLAAMVCAGAALIVRKGRQWTSRG